MPTVYQLGENAPFRLTKESGYKLMLAISCTGSKVISAAVDTTCPRTHICLRVEIPDGKLKEFRMYSESNPELVESAGGQ